MTKTLEERVVLIEQALIKLKAWIEAQESITDSDTKVFEQVDRRLKALEAETK